MNRMLALVIAIDRVLDEIFSGRWWWRARRLLAERRLSRALKAHGETSIEARHATERFREMQFAVTYWRAAPPQVRQVVRRARKQGANVADLQLLVLNSDLQARGDKVTVRRSMLVRALSAAFATSILLSWVLMCVLTVTAPGPTWLKATVLVILLSIFAVLYRGWNLYGYRSVAAIDRSGIALEEICSQSTSGTVTSLSPNGGAPEARQSGSDQ